jgi:hypothetical protein
MLQKWGSGRPLGRKATGQSIKALDLRDFGLATEGWSSAEWLSARGTGIGESMVCDRGQGQLHAVSSDVTAGLDHKCAVVMSFQISIYFMTIIYTSYSAYDKPKLIPGRS